jgi:hypothetical protein
LCVVFSLQLGSDLCSDDVPVKLAWLQAAALVLNPRDQAIAAHVVVVLEQIKKSLGVLAKSSLIEIPATRQSAMMLSHVVNSLLATCKASA